jgi:hypothetical protein
MRTSRSSPPPQSSRPPRARLRRLWLATLALAAVGASSASGCAASFDAPSKVNSLRILAVVPDKPYAAAGEEITFTMEYVDAVDQPRPVQIIWLGGCFDPPGDEYFGCYAQLAEVFQNLSGSFSPFCEPGLVSAGINCTEFKLTLPADIVTRRAAPEVGPHYGIAYVFFAACAGTFGVVPPEGTGTAGSFPLGCFDAEGKRLGAESFVPGYTQIYSFADGRTNTNPVSTGMNLDGAPIDEDFAEMPTVTACGISEDERRASGCGAEDPFSACTAYEIEAVVPEDVGEFDADATDAEGVPLKEAVWIDYYAEAGDFENDVKLISDPSEGFIPDQAVKWIPPDAPGPVRMWAVVHDARGGASVVERSVRVVE